MPETTRPTTTQLVLVPAIITLAVTALRLVGELQHWNERFFNRAGGGPGAIVGIVWLIFIFGAWFAVKLARAGEAPARVGRAIGLGFLGLFVLVASVAATALLKAPPIVQLAVACTASLAGGWVAARGWKELGRVLLAYGVAARVPVAALMLPAILGHWGTHYDALPPNFPPGIGPVATWALVGLLPQMTVWIGFTLIGGVIAGSIAAAVTGARRREAVATAA